MSDKNTFSLDPDFIRGFHKNMASDGEMEEFDINDVQVSEDDLLVRMQSSCHVNLCL